MNFMFGRKKDQNQIFSRSEKKTSSKNRKVFIQKLNLIKDEKKVLVFKTDKQADKFLAQISEVK